MNRAPAGSASAPRKGGPGAATNQGLGNRPGFGSNQQRGWGQRPVDPGYSQGRPDYGRPGYPGYNHGRYRPPYYGGYYPRYGYGFGGCYPYYNRYPYYHRYGCYSPYYRPYYSSYYPWFYPTFSLGIGYWGTPTYVYEPTVVYAEPTVIETVPSYGSTYYSEPTTTYYQGADPDTAYIEAQPYAGGSATGTTYVDQQPYAAQQRTVVEAPAPAPAYSAPTTAPSAPSQPSEPSEPQGSAPPPPDPKLIAAVSQGNEHFAAGRYADARRSYEDAMLIDNKDGVPRLLSALTSFAEGDYPGAALATRVAIESTPDLVYYPFNIKALYKDGSKFQEHIAALARHVDSQPSNQDAQFLLGYMWYSSGDAQNAKNVFSVLASTNSGNELYAALRDASSAALESLSQPTQQRATTSTTITPQ